MYYDFIIKFLFLFLEESVVLLNASFLLMTAKHVKSSECPYFLTLQKEEGISFVKEEIFIKIS